MSRASPITDECVGAEVDLRGSGHFRRGAAFFPRHVMGYARQKLDRRRASKSRSNPTLHAFGGDRSAPTSVHSFDLTVGFWSLKLSWLRVASSGGFLNAIDRPKLSADSSRVLPRHPA